MRFFIEKACEVRLGLCEGGVCAFFIEKADEFTRRLRRPRSPGC